MNYRNFEHLTTDIRKNLPRLHTQKFDLVVGIPRSGMIPAYMIGLYLNLDVISLDGFLRNDAIRKGSTRKGKSSLDFAQDAKRILLVDDSISSGHSLKTTCDTIPEELRTKIVTLAIYSSRPHREDVDLVFEFIPEPRVFEWNIFHKSVLERSCVDIDGVLCIDPTEDQNDDGDNYIQFLLDAAPFILPTYQIDSLVTNRLEKYRGQTESWLAKYGIRYKNLIMLDLPSKEARQRQGGHASHKANYFIRSGLDFFIESDERQAKEIARLAKKAVYCVESNQVYAPSLAGGVLDSQGALEYSRKRAALSAILPKRLVTKIRSLRRRR